VDLVIRGADGAPPNLQPIEVVERKGIGHPDTICDALAEGITLGLCRYYLERFGAILHHNVDKILLCGGSARPAFGGGEILEPLELYLAGRATREYKGERIPVDDIAVHACREWLTAHLPALDVERHVRIFPRFRPGSGALTSLFSKGQNFHPPCNDTSCGVGFAPVTPLESAVLDVEKTLNSAAMKKAHPAIGQDIKVMAVRHKHHIGLTIASAMIDRHLAGTSNYVEAKALVQEIAQELVRHSTNCDVDVVVNAADDLVRGDVFLTVTGTSAEAGDDGEVGRGNKTSGLITPYRPMTVEAAAGKNPVNHVGKLYNLAARAIAHRITKDVPGIQEALCVLVSQIGRSIEDPQIVDVRVALESGQRISSVRKPVRDVVQGELSRFPELQTALLEERIPVY
jgi:S-adenosylmethionine synthetase